MAAAPNDKAPKKRPDAPRKRKRRTPQGRPTPENLRPGNPVTKATRIELKLASAELLARRLPQAEVVRRLRAQYGAHQSTIASVCREVVREWEQQDRQAIADLRAAQRVRLYALINRAIDDGRLSVALSGEKFLARIEGTVMTEEERIAEETQAAGDDFDHRSEEDLAYFATRGYWPEQASDVN